MVLPELENHGVFHAMIFQDCKAHVSCPSIYGNLCHSKTENSLRRLQCVGSYTKPMDWGLFGPHGCRTNREQSPCMAPLLPEHESLAQSPIPDRTPRPDSEFPSGGASAHVVSFAITAASAQIRRHGIVGWSPWLRSGFTDEHLVSRC